MLTFLNVYRKVGGAFDIHEDGIRFYHPGGDLKPVVDRDRRAPRLHDRLAAAAHRRADPGRTASRSCTRPCTRTASASPTRSSRWAPNIVVHREGIASVDPAGAAPRARAGRRHHRADAAARRRHRGPRPARRLQPPHRGAGRRGRVDREQRRHHQPRLRALHRQARARSARTSTSRIGRDRTAPRCARPEKTVGWYFLARPVIAFLNVVGRFQFHRRCERIPKQGAVRARAEPLHSNLDPLVIASSVWKAGRVPRFLAKASLFKVPVLGWILRATGQIPVERGGRAARLTDGSRRRRLVENGSRGHRLPGGHPHPRSRPVADARQDGCGAARARARHPAHPDARTGACSASCPRYGKRISFFPRKDVRGRDRRAGRPLARSRARPLEPADARRGDRLVLMKAITRAARGLRGEKAPAERWNPAEHGQTETGRLTRSRQGRRPHDAGRGARRRQLGHDVREDPRRRRGATSRSGRAGPSWRARSPRASATATTCRASTCRASCGRRSSIPEALEGAEQVYLSVPSQSLRENLRDRARSWSRRAPIVVSLMKGVEKRHRRCG